MGYLTGLTSVGVTIHKISNGSYMEAIPSQSRSIYQNVFFFYVLDLKF